MSAPPTPRQVLYDAAELEAVVADMARRVAGLVLGRSDIVLVGIRRRGVPLAGRLRERLVRDFGLPAPPLVELDIKRYADDLTLLYPETRLTEHATAPVPDLAECTVIVVDDVIYQGHSLLRAVEHLARLQPAEIRTVVLADRGAARLPVRADVTGVRLDVAPDDILECHVPPYEPDFAIELVRHGRVSRTAA
jgi:pyrimidine operon attenuation protein/uracil phosphoribosyltransferase